MGLRGAILRDSNPQNAASRDARLDNADLHSVDLRLAINITPKEITEDQRRYLAEAVDDCSEFNSVCSDSIWSKMQASIIFQP